jgi:hypothetical protein
MDGDTVGRVMSKSYRPEVGAALEVLAAGLAPFVDREMRRHYTDEDWIVTAATKLGKREPVLVSPTDPQFQLEVLVRWWGPVFSSVLSRDTRATVQALRRARNDWAHIDDTHPIDFEYARRIHSLTEDILQEIGSNGADEIARLSDNLQRGAARSAAEDRGISETEVFVEELRELQLEREQLKSQVGEAQEKAKSATGHERAVSRQLAELQAQYASAAGLRERYIELEEQLRRAGEENEDAGELLDQLESAEVAVSELRAESSRLHGELDLARDALVSIDPADTRIGQRWLMLVAALVMVLGLIILAAGEGLTF